MFHVAGIFYTDQEVVTEPGMQLSRERASQNGRTNTRVEESQLSFGSLFFFITSMTLTSCFTDSSKSYLKNQQNPIVTLLYDTLES
jgi:hypothetical protein